MLLSYAVRHAHAHRAFSAMDALNCASMRSIIQPEERGTEKRNMTLTCK